MFDFARPWVLLFLVPLLFLARRLVRNPEPTLIHAFPVEWERFVVPRVPVPIPRVFRLGAMALLVLGLAGPQVRAPGLPTQGLSILFALDLSGSMATRDMGGRSRLAVAKGEVRRFVQARPHDLLGLVTFAREAVTRVPPTLDHGYFLGALDALEVEEEADGTAVGTGLGLAAHRVLQEPSPSRVVVLLTDGRNNSGSTDPLSVARAAAALEIRVHAVGVGGTGGDEPLDEPVLSRLSALTGGRYFRARDPGAFRAVLAQVDALEKGPIPPQITPVHDSAQGGFLLAGALLLLLEGLSWALPRRRAP